MKPRLVFCLLMIMLLACVPAFASVTTGTFGDQNSDGTYRVTIDSDGIYTFAADTGIKFPYQSGTTNDTLVAADSGRTYVVTSGATSGVVLSLPTAAVGLEYPIVSATTVKIFLEPKSTDTIEYASLAADSAITNTSAAKGDSITLVCVVANKWSVKHLTGTWADAGQYGDTD